MGRMYSWIVKKKKLGKNEKTRVTSKGRIFRIPLLRALLGPVSVRRRANDGGIRRLLLIIVVSLLFSCLSTRKDSVAYQSYSTNYNSLLT